jgi:hypothetical protein
MTSTLKNLAFLLALGTAFVLAPGLSMLSTVQAQDWRYEQQQRRLEEQRRREEYRRQRQMERYQRGGYNYGIDRNQNGVDDRYENRGYYGNGGYYGNEGYYGNDRGYYGNDRYYGNSGYNNAEYQKGYRDGLDRGMKDARTNRAMDPNNSSHYRKGNHAYRAGFERGFFDNYRRYSGRGW